MYQPQREGQEGTGALNTEPWTSQTTVGWLATQALGHLQQEGRKREGLCRQPGMLWLAANLLPFRGTR